MFGSGIVSEDMLPVAAECDLAVLHTRSAVGSLR